MIALCLWVALAAGPTVDPVALWDEARVALDHDRDVARAVPLLERIIAQAPDSRPADRARATLATLRALGPATEAWALPEWREATFVEVYRDAPITPLVAVRRSTGLDESAALAALEAHRGDRRWGWVVEREIGRRQFVEGHFVDAWQTADAAGDTGRVTASLRRIALRAAPVVGVLAIALALWGVRRRRRAPPRES